MSKKLPFTLCGEARSVPVLPPRFARQNDVFHKPKKKKIRPLFDLLLCACVDVVFVRVSNWTRTRQMHSREEENGPKEADIATLSVMLCVSQDRARNLLLAADNNANRAGKQPQPHIHIYRNVYCYISNNCAKIHRFLVFFCRSGIALHECERRASAREGFGRAVAKSVNAEKDVCVEEEEDGERANQRRRRPSRVSEAQRVCF